MATTKTLGFRNDGELRQSKANQKYVETHPIVQEGIAGFGSNSYYYTDHNVDGYVVRSSTRHGLDMLGTATHILEQIELAKAA